MGVARCEWPLNLLLSHDICATTTKAQAPLGADLGCRHCQATRPSSYLVVFLLFNILVPFLQSFPDTNSNLERVLIDRIMEFIVGIVVGGIPVILEAYDRYWTISKAFSCFRNHGSELDKLDTVLSTQKVLFRGGAIKILSTLTRNPAKAHSLLAGDATWAGLSSEPMLQIEVDSVKEAFTSWKGNLDQIHSILRSICTEVETFRSSCPTHPGTVRVSRCVRLSISLLTRSHQYPRIRLCFLELGFQRNFDCASGKRAFREI